MNILKKDILPKLLLQKSNNTDVQLLSKYIFFAGIATIVDMGLLFVLTTIGGVYYLYSAGIAYVCGMMTNFSLNRFFNFRARNRHAAYQFGLFVCVASVGLALNQLIIWSLVEFLHMWYLHAKILSVIVVMFVSFYGHKKITFGDSNSAQSGVTI
jgi:putative flippase GtrA